MRILQINSVCKRGSTGKIAYDLYTTLRRQGHNAAICYGRGPVVDEPDIFRFSGKFEVCFHALMTRLTGLTGCFSPFATRRLLRFIEAYNPDVVHIHELHAYFVNIAPVMNYLKKHNIKTVWTFHCEFMYTGKCGNAHDCQHWKQGCGKCPDKKGYVASWLFDFTARMFRQKKQLFDGFDNLIITPVSSWLMGRAKQSPILSGKHFRVVHNGIDLDVFYPRSTQSLREKHGLTDEKILVHVTPDFSNPRKGGRYVLDLARRLANENVKVVIIGISKPIEDCPANVIAINRTENQQQLAEYYSMGDVLVITSEMENLPTVCLEALCCGTPAVGFDTGGTRETAPAPYGHFVPFGDMQALEQAVRGVLSGELPLADSGACAEYGREHYDKRVMTGNYLTLYLKIYEDNPWR
ncbi:MAG: glycosyltransferase [Oscillospiraceae bacterium]|nr:glycosyltransferase [Oscillospiraceae bacterium]